MPKVHPLADVDDSTLRIEDFADDTWVLFANQTHSQKVMMAELSKHGINPKTIRTSTISNLVMWIEANAGVAPLCETHVVDNNPAFKLKFLPDMGYTHGAIAWSKYNNNPCSAVFHEYLASYFADKKTE